MNEAIRQAKVNINSIGAPAGEMTVILGPGWPGILLHEAIGHEGSKVILIEKKHLLFLT